MLRFAPYVVKGLWGHRTRTLLTVIGAAVALFVFCVVESARTGLDGLSRDARAQRSLIVFQANRFCPATSRLPEDYARTIARVAGVKQVVPVQVYLNNCRASLDLVVFHGLPASLLRQHRELDLIAGDWDGFEKQTDAAIIGKALARRRNLTVGQKFTVGELTVQVAGVFASASAADENVAYCHLGFLQRLRGRQTVGTVTQLEVQVADDADPAAVARAIDERLRGGPAATDTRSKGEFQAAAVGDLAELIGWAAWLGHACIGLVLMLVATTTLMAVQDRIREHAVLQAIGFTGPLVFGLVLVECLLISIAGGLLGVGAAVSVLGWLQPAVGTEGVTIALAPSLAVALRGVLVAVVAGLLAGLVPAWQAARADIVPSLRAV